MSFKKLAQDPDVMQGMSVPVPNRAEYIRQASALPNDMQGEVVSVQDLNEPAVIPTAAMPVSPMEVEDSVEMGDVMDDVSDTITPEDAFADVQLVDDLFDLSQSSDAELKGHGEITVTEQTGDDPPVTETTKFDVTLPPIPGADETPIDPIDIDDAKDDATDEVIIEEKPPEKPRGPWEWDIATFIEWAIGRMKAIPKHSGNSIPGLLRAINFLKSIEKEIRKAMSTDRDGILEIAKIDNIRSEITSGIKRLEERLKKLEDAESGGGGGKKVKKQASLQKEAFGTFVVTVPIFISSIARICLNSMVSAGKDIEEVFADLSKKYKLDAREQLSLIQVLADMGYPMRRPRGYDVDEEIDITSTDNFDWSAIYPA